MKHSTIILLSLVAMSLFAQALSSNRFLANEDKRRGNDTAANDTNRPQEQGPPLANVSIHAPNKPHPNPKGQKPVHKKQHPVNNHNNNSNNANNTQQPPQQRPQNNTELNTTDVGARLLANKNNTNSRVQGKNHKAKAARRQPNHNNSSHANNTQQSPQQRPESNTDSSARVLAGKNATNGNVQAQKRNHKAKAGKNHPNQNTSSNGNNTQVTPIPRQRSENNTDSSPRLLAGRNDTNVSAEGRKRHNKPKAPKKHAKKNHSVKPNNANNTHLPPFPHQKPENNTNLNATDAGARLLAGRNDTNGSAHGPKRNGNGKAHKKPTHAVRPRNAPRLNETEEANLGGNGEEDLDKAFRLLVSQMAKANAQKDKNGKAQGNEKRAQRRGHGKGRGNGRNATQGHVGNHTLAGEDAFPSWNATNKA